MNTAGGEVMPTRRGARGRRFATLVAALETKETVVMDDLQQLDELDSLLATGRLVVDGLSSDTVAALMRPSVGKPTETERLMAGISHHIRTIGLFNTKARNVHRLSEILIADHDGTVPEDRAALEALPGVGRKTANVVLNEAFGHPTIAVDTHIFRVGNRTGMAPGKTPDHVERELLRRVPDKWKRGAHHWLILHGRYVCKARKPDCGACRISEFCLYKDKTA